MPVKEIGKAANVRCSHLRSILHADGVGCSIYHKRPNGCRVFSCMWLKGADIGRRPDQTHLVVDPSPDFVEAQDDDTGKTIKLIVIQVWVDPAYPLAHRDAAFRDWLRSTNRPALIRYGSHRGMLLAYQNCRWFEIESNTQSRPEHTPEEIFAVIGEAR
jgi:hypothetical protein